MEIIKEIVSVQKADTGVNALIDGRIYPYHTDDTSQGCIVYTPVPLEDDKVKQTWRIEITIISKQLANAMQIDEAVRNTLLTLGDSQLSNSILQVALNGGGTLYNYETETYHQTCFYYVTARK